MTCIYWSVLTDTESWHCEHCSPNFVCARLPLTDDSSDVVPHRQTVGLGLLPAVVVAQVEGKPEEEGIVDQLQTRVRQGILQHRIVWDVWIISRLWGCILKQCLRLTGSTPGRRKAWQKLMAWGDSTWGSLCCWMDRCTLAYTSSSSSSLIRGRWLSESVSTGPSTVSDSRLKPEESMKVQIHCVNSWVMVMQVDNGYASWNVTDVTFQMARNTFVQLQSHNYF